jgi:hypothetical protein
MNKNGFETAFKKAVTNFDETRVWFIHKSKSYAPSQVCFVWKNKLCKVNMHKAQYDINLWKNHFIEFLETGEFDYNAYWMIYKEENEPIGDVLKFPLCKFYDDEFFTHSPEMNCYLEKYREEVDDSVGIMQVQKPLTKFLTNS